MQPTEVLTLPFTNSVPPICAIRTPSALRSAHLVDATASSRASVEGKVCGQATLKRLRMENGRVLLCSILSSLLLLQPLPVPVVVLVVDATVLSAGARKKGLGGRSW